MPLGGGSKFLKSKTAAPQPTVDHKVVPDVTKVVSGTESVEIMAIESPRDASELRV